MLTILNDAASVPPRLYTNVSSSRSVAETALPMSSPESVFSAMERVVLSSSSNVGTLFSCCCWIDTRVT